MYILVNAKKLLCNFSIFLAFMREEDARSVAKIPPSYWFTEKLVIDKNVANVK